MPLRNLVRVLKNLHRWDSARDFMPWLLAIAGNRCRTALATRRRRPVAESTVELVADDAPDRRPADQLAEEVHLALADLRPEYSQAFLLFHDQELSYAEIAESMQVPLGTIKNLGPSRSPRADRSTPPPRRNSRVIPHRQPRPHRALALPTSPNPLAYPLLMHCSEFHHRLDILLDDRQNPASIRSWRRMPPIVIAAVIL